MPKPDLANRQPRQLRRYPLLPTLTLNRSFMQAFIAADPPCFAMGLVEEHGRPCGFLGLRPEVSIPADITNQGFNFGHSLYESSAFEVIHFAFEFYGFKTYNVLINPNNPIVQAVLQRMIENGDYFFFALEATGRATAFRAEIEQDNLSQIKANFSRIRQSMTTKTQYDLALCAFEDDPRPEGTLLQWVCCDQIDYLDLTTDRMELKPA